MRPGPSNRTGGFPSLKFTFALIVIPILLLAGTIHIYTTVDVPGEEPVPDTETNVACYKWVENGTAHVQCPEKVYAPDSVVNITVKHCSEYQYKIDEQKPCERD